MPKSEVSRRIDARPGLDGFYDDQTYDTTEDSTPNTPSGVSVRAVVDGILIQVDFLVDTAHLHPRFQAFVVYAKPIGTESAEPLEVGRFSDSSWTWQQYRGGYVGWQIALSAVSNTGYESALTSYSRCVISTFFDDFANYGGGAVSAVTNLWWLKVADFDSDESWVKTTAGGSVSDETSIYIEGDGGKRATVDPASFTIGMKLANTQDFSQEGRFTDDDYVAISVYLSYVTVNTELVMSFVDDVGNGSFGTYWREGVQDLSVGWNYLVIKKSDLTTSGTPSWASIDWLLVSYDAIDSAGEYAIFDDWRIIKADPDNANTFNDTGYAWDFNDGGWHAYFGDRTGEPSYAFSLGQIESPADDDYLATANNIGVPNGIASAGIMFKVANGAAGLVFRVEDDTLASEDGLTAELNTTANTLTLNQYAAGAKTELSSVSYTCDPDLTYFVGVDFRDPNHQNRVDVYVATTEYELFTGDTMKLSYSSDTPWPNGQGVGVINHACNCRFVNFRAGSPMTADYAHRAGVALKALVAIPGSIAHADLSSVTEDQHHTAFVGLADNADAAINPDDADDRIQVTDDGLVNADAAGNTLALSITTAAPGTIEPDDAADAGIAVSLARSDHQHAIAAAAPDADSVNVAASTEGDSTSFARADHTHNLDESIAPTWTGVHIHSNADVKLQSLTDLIVFSDAGVTEKARIDGATGNITTAGTVDTVDVSDFKTTYDAHDHGAGDPTQVDHATLTNVTADQHHAGFIGLEDNAATAITPAADDRIQITDDGKINADASGNTLALSIGTAAPGADSVNVAASGEGDAATLARSNHTHNLDEAIIPTWTGKHVWTATPAMEIDVATGDPAIILDTQGADKFILGVDDTDGDMFKISSGNALGTNDRLVIDSAGKTFIDDNANAQMTVGLTINQGASDDEILALKSSDVAHGITSETETDTFGMVKKASAADGGLQISGYSDAHPAHILSGIGTTADATKTKDSRSLVEILAGLKSGANVDDPGIGSNVLGVRRYYGDVPIDTAVIFDRDGHIYLVGGAGCFIAQNTTNEKTWMVGSTPINMDFTGTSYDTDAELQAMGVRLSDADTPFPTTIATVISGTWTHSAGNGWQPASATDAQGPAIIIPLMRPSNWEIALTLNYTPTSTAHQFGIDIGYIAGSNHWGASAEIYDVNASANELTYTLITNDGDDTATVQYTGAALAGTGNRVCKFRCQNGAVGIYDDEDDAYHYYTGRQSAGIAYTPAYAFINVWRPGTGATLSRVYLSSLTLTYLL